MTRTSLLFVGTIATLAIAACNDSPIEPRAAAPARPAASLSGFPGTTLAPIAVNDAFQITGGTVSQALDVLANDRDLQNLPLHLVAIVQAPAHGSASIVSNKVQYSPAANWSGTDAFSYQISNGSATAIATASVTVTPKPVVAPDTLADSTSLSVHSIRVRAVAGGANGTRYITVCAADIASDAKNLPLTITYARADQQDSTATIVMQSGCAQAWSGIQGPFMESVVVDVSNGRFTRQVTVGMDAIDGLNPGQFDEVGTQYNCGQLYGVSAIATAIGRPESDFTIVRVDAQLGAHVANLTHQQFCAAPAGFTGLAQIIFTVKLANDPASKTWQLRAWIPVSDAPKK